VASGAAAHRETGRSRVIERPRWAWIAVAVELFTAAGAIPVGLLFIADPTGAAIGLPAGWIESTVFGSYLLPGIVLLLMNGLGMLAAAWLTVMRHPLAPWLTGALGIGLLIWIGVQVLVMPERMFLQGVFAGAGLVLGFVALSWLRRTGWTRP
jgi:hypothetical protein